MKIKYKGMTLFGVSVSGRFTGPDPKRVQGEWSVDLWLFSIGGPFDFTHRRRPAAAARCRAIDPLAGADRGAARRAQLERAAAAASRQLVSFRNRPGSAEVLVHPLGELGVRQQLLPLGIELDLFAGGVPQGERRFAITKAFVGDDPVTDLRPANEHFAAADFIELTDDEKLHRPSFEAMPAGVSLAPKALGFGGQAPGTANQAAVSEIDFEEIVSTPTATSSARRRRSRSAPCSSSTSRRVRAGGAVAAAERGGTAKFETATGRASRVGPERFAVAGVDDLAPVRWTAPRRTSSRTRPSRRRSSGTCRRTRSDRGALQVVPAFRAGGRPT